MLMCSGTEEGRGGKNKIKIEQDLLPIPGSIELLEETASRMKLHPWAGAIQAPVTLGCV